MGKFMDWLRGPKIEQKGPIADVSPELVDAIKWGIVDGTYGTIFKTQPSVYTVVEFIAWQISQVRLKVYERRSSTDRVELGDSDLAQLLRHPAPGLTYQRWMHSLVADICLYGNAYHEKVEAGEGARALMPLPPTMVAIVGGTLVNAAAYDIRLNGQDPRLVSAEAMFHPRRYNPGDLRIGVSPLEPLRQILRDEQEAIRANYDMWMNGARVAGYLERAEDARPWSDDERKEFRAEWQAAYGGRGNSYKTAVLEGMKFKEASWSPRETEFIAGRKLTLETVARAYNVPVSLLGLTQSATFASQKEFHRQLYVDTLGPWFRMIEAEVQESIVPWFTNDPAIYTEFNVEEKLRLSFEEQAGSLRQSVGVPHMSVNEARALQNLPVIDDEGFDEPVKPANVAYAGEPGEAPMPEQRQTPDLRAATAPVHIIPLPVEGKTEGEIA